MSTTSSDVRVRAIDAALWLGTAVAAGLTVWLSIVAAPPESSVVEGIDKLQHLLAYAATVSLFLLAAVWRPGRGPGVLWRMRAWVLPIALVAAATIEVIQGRVGRQQEVADAVAGGLGAALAVGANVLLRRRG